MWDLSSPTRVRIRALCSGSTVLTTGPPGKSLVPILQMRKLSPSMPETWLNPHSQERSNWNNIPGVWESILTTTQCTLSLWTTSLLCSGLYVLLPALCMPEQAGLAVLGQILWLGPWGPKRPVILYHWWQRWKASLCVGWGEGSHHWCRGWGQWERPCL